jgi:hypothetical protein
LGDDGPATGVVVADECKTDGSYSSTNVDIWFCESD